MSLGKGLSAEPVVSLFVLKYPLSLMLRKNRGMSRFPTLS